MDVRNASLMEEWDVLIIGTGMGGATLGYALAQSGQRVLFCEKGRSLLACGILSGQFAECFIEVAGLERLQRAGRYSEELLDISGRKQKQYIPFIGSGTGGSSALYGMALERFFPEDFEPRRCHPNAAMSSLPNCWPVTYEELRPFYREAERLYRVRGGCDPCRSENDQSELLEAPNWSSSAQEIADTLSKSGMRPYRLPMACEYVEGCDTCQGFLCDRACKNDAFQICLKPAIQNHGATLLAECEVQRLIANRERITAVECRWKGDAIQLRAKKVVLAAGALATPRLLLSSRSDVWPNGLANHSGLVGRNLMRHFVDLYALKLTHPPGKDRQRKEIAFNDLYVSPEGKLGTVQSFGVLPPAEAIVEEMHHNLRQNSSRLASGLFTLAKPMLQRLLESQLSGRVLFASIAEDLPFEENQVSLCSNGKPRLNYRISDYDRTRIQSLRTKLRKILRPLRPQVMKQAENNERLAHVCGTCRFGDDPCQSVLDRNCRAHEVDNLFVVDSSFFPSSGGTNPALTIAANALRVARMLAPVRTCM